MILVVTHIENVFLKSLHLPSLFLKISLRLYITNHTLESLLWMTRSASVSLVKWFLLAPTDPETTEDFKKASI